MLHCGLGQMDLDEILKFVIEKGDLESVQVYV